MNALEVGKFCVRRGELEPGSALICLHDCRLLISEQLCTQHEILSFQHFERLGCQRSIGVLKVYLNDMRLPVDVDADVIRELALGRHHRRGGCVGRLTSVRQSQGVLYVGLHLLEGLPNRSRGLQKLRV